MDKKQILSAAEKVDLMSEEAQEIVGRVPPWIVRWGITVLFCLLVAFLAGAWWIRYPDEMVVGAEVRFEYQPLRVCAPVQGLMEQIRIGDGLEVFSGDTLLLLIPGDSQTGLMAVTAGMSGRLSIAGGWSHRQKVEAGELLGTIVPDTLGTPYVVAFLPEADARRVHPGQKVLVRLHSYPSDEYGLLTGRLEAVSWSPVIRDSLSVYPVRVALTDSLTTSFRKTIDPTLELRGTAHIQGEERSLLDRLFHR